jgi:hypothetical protein
MNAKMAGVIKNVVQALVVVALGYLVRHKVAETQSAAWVAAGWLLSAWVVLRLGMALKRGVSRFREHTQTGVNLDNLDKLVTASTHPWMRGYYAMEKRAYRGFWRTITAKPVAPVGTFPVAGGPKGRIAAAVLLMLVAASAVVAAIFLPGLVTAFWPRLFAVAGVGYTLLYAAIWIIGARRNLKEGGHSITLDELILDVGLRGSGAVPLGSIACCSVLDGAAGNGAWFVSPGEAANVMIQLNAETRLATTAFGSPREISTRVIALYVDRPDEFATALARARASVRQAASA